MRGQLKHNLCCVLPLQLMSILASSLILDIKSLWIPSRFPFLASLRNSSSGSSSSMTLWTKYIIFEETKNNNVHRIYRHVNCKQDKWKLIWICTVCHNYYQLRNIYILEGIYLVENLSSICLLHFPKRKRDFHCVYQINMISVHLKNWGLKSHISQILIFWGLYI